MSSRELLIARKHEVASALAGARRRLDAVRDAEGPLRRRQRRRLENEVERLMAEEYRLRNAIDRSN